MIGTIAALTGLLWAGAQAQVTDITDPRYGCTDGSASPAFRVAYEDTVLACGTQISAAMVANAPDSVTYAAAADLDTEFYTLLLVNPDDIIDAGCDIGVCLLPIVHWAVFNIAADDLVNGNIPEVNEEAGDIGKAYIRPDPFAPGLISPMDFRFHYNFILYKQPALLELDPAASFASGEPLDATIDAYGLEAIEQTYYLFAVDECLDGEEVCYPCPETNTFVDPNGDPFAFPVDTITMNVNCVDDLCNVLPEFVDGCVATCERVCPVTTAAVDSSSSGLGAAATAAIAVAAVVGVVGTVGGALKYYKNTQPSAGHTQLLEGAVLSNSEAVHVGSSVQSFEILPSELASV
jgi:hypothetical protein